MHKDNMPFDLLELDTGMACTIAQALDNQHCSTDIAAIVAVDCWH